MYLTLCYKEKSLEDMKMKTKKKSRFLTFCFSLLPGAGEMYMGFMKMGVSLMSIFFLTICALGSMGFEGMAALTAVVIWFYSFFHANHLVALSDEDFEKVEDAYIFGMDAIIGGKDFVQKHYKAVAGILIFAGVMILWQSALDLMWNILPDYLMYILHTVSDFVPRVVVAFVIIIAGIKLIKGRKAQLAWVEEKEKTEEA